MERLASASWLTTTKGRLPMPKYEVYATVTEEWVLEVDANDAEEAKDIARDEEEGWKRCYGAGDCAIYDALILENTKGETE